MNRPADRSLTPRDPLIGRVLDGRYRVLRRIGKGGMGNVYLAEHVLIGRRVAIKTLHESLCNPELIERFHREARAAATIGNDHIVDVTDMGCLDNGSHYLVLEYLEGSDLAFRVASRGPLEVAAAVGLMLQLCAALRAVHAAGIVHRDLKPDNLFLIERDGTPDFLKVLDFGVCKFREGAEHMRLTATGVALGTPHYMAPEQVEGRSDVDLRADLYAAGGILHFALTGSPPFDAPSMPSLFMQICEDAPKPLSSLRPDVPPALERLVQRALAKRREERFQDASQLAAAVRAVLSGEPAARDSMHEGETLPAFDSGRRADATLPGRRRWPLRLSAAALGTGLALGVAQLAPREHSPPSAMPRAEPRPRSAAAPDISTSLDPALQPAAASPTELPLGSAPPPVTPLGPRGRARAASSDKPGTVPHGAASSAAAGGDPKAAHLGSEPGEAGLRAAARSSAAAAIAGPDTAPATEETEARAPARAASDAARPPPSAAAQGDTPVVPHGELRRVFER